MNIFLRYNKLYNNMFNMIPFILRLCVHTHNMHMCLYVYCVCMHKYINKERLQNLKNDYIKFLDKITL